ncbi:hypothetical protein WA158_005845 [Blastocystis sp. Blastoise]
MLKITNKWISPDVSMINNKTMVRYDNISSKNEHNNDVFQNNVYKEYTKEIIDNIREGNPDSIFVKGIKITKSSFDQLLYFDSSKSFSLDIMHLFGNICNTLLPLLFEFSKDDTEKVQSHDKENSKSKLYKVQNLNLKGRKN